MYLVPILIYLLAEMTDNAIAGEFRPPTKLSHITV